MNSSARARCDWLPSVGRYAPLCRLLATTARKLLSLGARSDRAAPSSASQQKGEASLSRADLEAELEQLKHRLARNTETLQAQLLSAQVREQRHVERALSANMTAAVAQVRVFRGGVALLKASRPDCPHPCEL